MKLMRRLTSLIFVLPSWVLLTLLSPCAVAQADSNEDNSALRREIQDIKEGQKILLKELASVKELLLAKSQPKGVPDQQIDLKGVPFLGDPSARVVLVEYTDFQCSFCARHASQTLPQVVAEYVKTGKIRYVVKDFPLGGHAFAKKAAEATHCATREGKFWDMHDALFANQKALAPDNLLGYANELKLDPAEFSDCLKTGASESIVSSAMAEAQQSGMEGTPTFLFAIDEGKDRGVRVKSRIFGAVPFDQFKKALDDLLAADLKK